MADHYDIAYTKKDTSESDTGVDTKTYRIVYGQVSQYRQLE